MICLGVGVFACLFGIYPDWCSLTFLDLWFDIWQYWGILRHDYFKYFFCSFGIPTKHMLHLCNCPIVLGYSVPSFFFFFVFQFGEISIDIYSSSEVLSSAVCSLLISPSKVFFISVTVFLISSLSFWFFKEKNFHFSIYATHLFLHVAYFFH